MEKQNEEPTKNSKLKKWVKRVGVGGLIFFTLKGIVWLFVFYFGFDLLEGCFGK